MAMFNIRRYMSGAWRVLTDHVPSEVRERMLLTFVETGNPVCGNHLYMMIMFLYIKPGRKTVTSEAVPRPIAVCSSAQETKIQGLLTMLRTECTPINVQFLALPYNDLDNFRMEKGLYSGLILCHSINNRKFSITNVLDALYDAFLPHARDVLGGENVSVVVHDFQWPLRAAGARNLPSSAGDHANIKEAHMESFRIRQPTTFHCSDLVMISGRLEDNVVEMDEEDKQSLLNFVNTRSTTILEVEECLTAEGDIHSENCLVVASGDLLLDLSLRPRIDFPGRVVFHLRQSERYLRPLKYMAKYPIGPVMKVIGCTTILAVIGYVLVSPLNVPPVDTMPDVLTSTFFDRCSQCPYF